MSILDNLAQQGENDWLSQKLEDNPDEDEALQTTARIATAHIWPFLASSISDDDYRARRGVKEDEVRYVCATIGPHITSALVDHVLAGFDRDYATMHKTAQEELGLLDLLPALSGGGGGGGGGGEEEGDDDGPFSTPKVSSLHQAPGGGVHGPYYIREEGGGYDVVNAQGESKGHHDTRGEALAQQRALYVNIPKARQQAEDREGKAPPKAVQAVGEPGSEEQREHEGAYRPTGPYRRTADVNNPSGTIAPLPIINSVGEDDNDKEDNDDEDKPPPLRHHKPQGPGLFDTPKIDQELEPDISAYYGPWGPGNPNRQAASLRVASTVGYGSEAVPFELLSPEERAAHIAHEHQMDPSAVKGMSALGSAAMHQVLHDEAGLDVDHYHPRGDFMGSDPGISIDRYGHIRFAAYDRSRDPQLEENDDPDPDRYWADQEAGNPENDVYEHPEEEPEHMRAPGYHRGRQRNPKNRIPSTWKNSARRAADPDLDDPDLDDWAPAVKSMSHADLIGHMADYHFGPGPRRESAEAAVQKTLGLPAGRMQFVHDNAHEQGSRMHSPHTHGAGAFHPEHPKKRRAKEAPVKEAQLARSAERPLERHWRPDAYERGYDPADAFPGYYGEAQAPRRPRTAQFPGSAPDTPNIGTPGSAPTTPNVGGPPPPTPASSTGASGLFDPGNALNTSSPAGPVSGNFAQADTPQDIQAQLGQIPTLSHKVGAKLAEMAAEALAHNSGLSALAAIELALKALRLYPKVAIGGADYLHEPETLQDCPQCSRQAYNPEINRCHFCGYYDAGAEPTIEVT